MTADITAFVIAGGRSSRMGRDKAFLTLDGSTLLQRALAVARSVSAEVRIVGPREKFTAFGNVIEDVYPGQGPLAGIHAALTSSEFELNLMIGVDTPFLDPRFVQYLSEEARTSGATVTVPRVGSQPQPLCAVYRREFALVAEEALRQRRNNIAPLFAGVTTRKITEVEMQELAFDPRMFDNLNTPKEWDQACRRIHK